VNAETVVRCPKCGFTTKLIQDASGSPNFPLGHEMAHTCEYLIDQKIRGAIHDWTCPHLKDEIERRSFNGSAGA
jgi:hypothetical protein